MKCNISDGSQYEEIIGRKEKYPPSAISQAILLHNHPDKFFSRVTGNIVPKMLEDLAYILEQGWSASLSSQGLYQAVLCGSYKTRVSNATRYVDEDFEAVMGKDNLRIVYNSHDRKDPPQGLEGKTTNIVSRLNDQPRLIVPPKSLDTGIRKTVFPWMLDLLEYGYLLFLPSPQGKYATKTGINLDLECFLSMQWSLLHFRGKDLKHAESIEQIEESFHINL